MTGMHRVSLIYIKGVIGAVNRGQTMQWPKEKGQIMIYETLHRKLMIEQHGPHKEEKKSGVNLSSPEG
jgi:hypothetical protein